jgi:hypothetical protein
MMARDAEAGSVLVVVLMVMLGLLALGVTAMWLTSGNLNVGANISQRTQALYVAEAGVERAREILVRLPPGNVPSVMLLASGANANCATWGAWDEPVTGLIPGSGPAPAFPSGALPPPEPNGVGVIMRDPNQGNIELCGIQYPQGSEWQRNADAGPQFMGRYTVWIRNDEAEARQGLFSTDNNGAVVVRSRGVAFDGRTTVVLEVTLGPNLGAPPSPGMLLAGPGDPGLSGKNANAGNSGVSEGVVSN